jgi:segregation and condensation protein A
MKISFSKKNPYQIVLPIFEGPMDLLLHLIRENKVDIYDIPIAEVTDQYLQYLYLMEAMDLDIAGEFLVMAATLLEIKSRMLLPPDPIAEDDEESVDPRTELVERLIEYQRYKEAAELFREHETERQKVFKGASRDIEIDYTPYLLKDVQPEDLIKALQRLLAEVGEGEEEVTTIIRKRISVRMKMSEIWRRVTNSGQGVLFDELFDDPKDRADIVITFLAILELLKLQRIAVKQNKTFDRIKLLRKEMASVEKADNGGSPDDDEF